MDPDTEIVTYEPPEGFEDFPFFWVFDAGANGQNLVNGNSYNNLSVYILGGWGEFHMRRAAGWGTVLNPATGTYRLRDAVKSNLMSDPLPAPAIGSDDLMFPDEVVYPETSLIQFDLANVLLS